MKIFLVIYIVYTIGVYFMLTIDILGKYNKKRIWVMLAVLLPGVALLILPIKRKMDNKDDITLFNTINRNCDNKRNKAK